MRNILRRLVDMQYDRNDMTLGRGKFRVRGDTIEVHPAYEESVLRIEMFGDTVDRITTIDPLTGEQLSEMQRAHVFPATHYVTGNERMAVAMGKIEDELQVRLKEFEENDKLLEAQRLRMRTSYDLEMMGEVGYCNGIENYSMHIDGRDVRRAAVHAARLLPRRLPARDRREPRRRAAAARPVRRRPQPQGHARRPRVPAAVGARQPAAHVRRGARTGQPGVFLSATPSAYELRVSSKVVEQIVRPTGLVDPEVIVKPTKGQIDDLIELVNGRIVKGERVLVTTLTKKMAEDLTDYLLEQGLRVRYLHSQHRHDPTHRDPARPAPRRVRRAGRHQPAARGSRPARGVAGVHPRRRQGGLPALGDVADPDDRPRRPQRRRPGGDVRRQRDRLDGEGDRRDATGAGPCSSPTTIEHGIDPQTIRKAVGDILSMLRPDGTAPFPGKDKRRQRERDKVQRDLKSLPQQELARLIQTLEEEMHEASAALKFEYAARLRDEINDLRREIRDAE